LYAAGPRRIDGLRDAYVNACGSGWYHVRERWRGCGAAMRLEFCLCGVQWRFLFFLSFFLAWSNSMWHIEYTKGQIEE